MEWIPGGDFMMGSDDFYREERPSHRESVDPFFIDRHLVTNVQFQTFVDATGYVTLAERPPRAADYPQADPALLVPGSLVFQKPPGPVDLRDARAWWAYVPGADWRHPKGPGSNLDALGDHPVVHVAHEDAKAFADWAGKALPSEAEWEFAARAGSQAGAYAWGDVFEPDGEVMANTWHGRFPWENLGARGYEGTSPVGAFPTNGFGLSDMIGNVWEWTSSPFAAYGLPKTKACCVPPTLRSSADQAVVKGGSHLCAPNYCLRYRPAARQAEALDTSTGHIGFRCVLRPAV